MLAEASERLRRQGATDRLLGLPAELAPEALTRRLNTPGPARAQPPRFQGLRARWQLLKQRVRRWLLSEYWVMGVIDAPVQAVLSVSHPPVRWITRPAHAGYWADPFGVPGHPDKLVAEYFDQCTGVGHLELLTLQPDGGIDLRRKVELGQGGHASFPNTFEMDGEVWCLPETVSAGALGLHRVTADGQWPLAYQLLEGVQAADPALLKVDGRYWLFYTDLAFGAMDNLCLAYADRLEGPWTPHANNPVKVDVRGARMAGQPFVHNGAIYRPAQDCLSRYGAAICVHRIQHLSPTRYEEVQVRRMAGDPASDHPDGMHTLSAWGDKTLVDGKVERINSVALLRKLRHRLGFAGPFGKRPHPTKGPVLVHVPHLRTGGGEISMLRVAEGLAARGLEVELIVNEATSRELTLPAGVQLVDLQAQGTARALLKLTQRIRERRPRCVISAFAHTNLASIAAVKMARVGAMSIVTEHAPLRHQIRQQANWRYRALPGLLWAGYRHADAVVAVSQGVRDDLMSIVGTDKHIHCIHNPVLPIDFEAALAREPAHPWLQDPALQVVMSLSRLSEEKDLPTLVRAFRRVHANHPHARLLLVGDGDQRLALQELISAAGLADVAQLPGRTSEPLAWMRRAAVFAMASTFEGYGNVLVEALAVGTPVVSTDCPVGPREILEHGRFGDLVPVGDDLAMARAISRQLTNRSLPEGASKAARQRTLSRTADDYVALLGHLELTRGSSSC